MQIELFNLVPEMPRDRREPEIPRLRKYQKEGVISMLSMLQKRSAVYLADEMGLGKTAQAIVAAKAMRAQKILVICPASVVLKWAREFDMWDGRRLKSLPIVRTNQAARIGDFPITILSYNRACFKSVIDAVCRQDWDVVIFDEAGHNLRNHKTIRVKTCLSKYWPKAKRQICLSGTPLPNSVQDGFVLFNKIAPEIFPSRHKFCFRYMVPEKNYFTGYFTFSGGRHLGELARLLKENFMVRRLQRDVDDELPRIVFTKNFVDIGKARDDLRFSPEEVEHIEDCLARGRGIMISEHMATVRRGLGLAKIEVIWLMIKEQMEEQDRLVVFYWHKDVGAELERLCKTNYAVLKLDGSVPPEKRDQMVVQFQNKKNPARFVFLAQIQAAGIGIDLTAARTGIFAEYSWAPADISQAFKRLHRLGQTNRVNILYCIAENTADDQITSALLLKARVCYKALDFKK